MPLNCTKFVKTLASILLLFAIISILSISPSAFAEVTITTGSVNLSTPGCEETDADQKLRFSDLPGCRREQQRRETHDHVYVPQYGWQPGKSESVASEDQMCPSMPLTVTRYT